MEQTGRKEEKYKDEITTQLSGKENCRVNGSKAAQDFIRPF
jgi:hypothetical protein